MMLLTLFFKPIQTGRWCLTRRWLIPLLLVILTLTVAAPTLADNPDLAVYLHGLAHHAQEGQEAAEQNNVNWMKAEYDDVHAIWESFEDEVKAKDPTAYVELEGALATVRTAVEADLLDPKAVERAYAHLKDEAEEFAVKFDGQSAAPAIETAIVAATPADLMKNLDIVYQAVEKGDVPTAYEQLKQVILLWPSVEGAIATQSPEAYTTIEVALGRATAALQDQPANLAEAEAAIEQLRATLAPFVMSTTYTMFDAAAIMLREGLEALLVIVALLAFLRRSGNSDKRAWVWVGGGLGILASLIAAFALQAIFSQASAGQNREVVEGVTGLVAAGLLFYVSYWLHSKASLHGWQKFINQRTTQALKRGSLTGLALLAFLAVFREGAETTVFYLGMAPAIGPQDLLLGLGLGVAVLIVAAVLMLGVGMRLPLRPFFTIAGLLVYYLGFKFLGTGIHALQVAGTLPATPISGLPALPLIGFYPTWEGALAQLALLGAAMVAFLYLRVQDRRAAKRMALAAAQQTAIA